MAKHEKESIITKEALEFLTKREFINIATSDQGHRPNVAPKFLLKVERDCIYLVDYVLGKTWRNIQLNKLVSLSTINIDKLVGYQINGEAEIIEAGPTFGKLLNELHDKIINFSARRVIEGVRKEKKHKDFEVTFPEKVLIFKIKVLEIVQISPTGELKRERQ